jgi:uncharacterized protein (DUF488 family)
MEFYTLGVYQSGEEEFFNKLIEHGIDTFCDIRQRRGVRGARYAFVNSKRLQARLQELAITYRHVIDLAPTREIRELQKQADATLGEQKRSRNRLGEVFCTEYNKQILEPFNLEGFVSELTTINARRVVLFCVEEKPEACHRSLVTDALSQLEYTCTHL